MLEKRIYPRIPIELKVTCLASNTALKPIKGVSIDLSVGGMLLKTDVGVPLSNRIEGTLHLPVSDEAIAFKADLMWRKVDGSAAKNGLQFVGMNDANRRRLEGLLKSVWTQMLSV